MLALAVAAPAPIILAVRRQRTAHFYVAAWGLFLCGVFLYLFKTLGVLPSNSLTEWGILVGGTLQVILLSLGLADRINTMRRNVGSLNRKLEQNVDELRGALRRAEAARRAKSEFLAGVSHELRTPLNTIINLPEAMLEDFEDAGSTSCAHCGSVFELEPGDEVDAHTPCPECQQTGLEMNSDFHGDLTQGRKRLRHVVRSGRHLLEVINDILDVSRLEAGQMSVQMRTVELCDHLRLKLSPLEGLAESQGVHLGLELSTEPILVKGDPTKLAQIAINLVGNAVKFSDGSGKVTVTLEREGASCLLSVADEGVGIAAEDKARIFDSFVQAEGGGSRRFGGSGLGLTITKQLVEMHGGTISVASELGAGSTFSVRLPLVGAEQPDSVQPTQSTQPTQPTQMAEPEGDVR